jgi:chemotaxis methyl-accepting protein methylase
MKGCAGDSGSDRYPAQSAIITEWFRRRGRQGKKLRCLDAACGDGGATYALARLCADHCSLPDNLDIEGWTLEPLEAWAAAHSRFPHDPARERLFQGEAGGCFERGLDAAIRFCCVNILHVPESDAFDLILCNGLLGGPIIHDREDMDTAVRNLTGLLAPGGMLLVEDHFHGGWKQRCPQQELRALCERYGLLIVKSAAGLYALKPD